MIGVIGGNGFMGSAILKGLGGVNINRDNYFEYLDTPFDILINANGNSNKYWGSLNPLDCFNKSVVSVYKSMFDFKFKKYIYISSIDAAREVTTYGLHKFMAEKIVEAYCDDYSIIRLPAVIGPGAVKGVVADIMDGNVVFLTADSTLMLISLGAVVDGVSKLINSDRPNRVECFFPSDSISIEDIGKVLNKKVRYFEELRSEYYIPSGDSNLESSLYYLESII